MDGWLIYACVKAVVHHSTSSRILFHLTQSSSDFFPCFLNKRNGMEYRRNGVMEKGPTKSVEAEVRAAHTVVFVNEKKRRVQRPGRWVSKRCVSF